MTLGALYSLPDGAKFLVTVSDWSMSEPFNKDDVVQIVATKGCPKPGEPVLIEAEGKLVLCILGQDERDSVRLSFTGDHEHISVPADNIRVIGKASGIRS